MMKNGECDKATSSIATLKKEFVFFDLDGTLIDSAHAITVAWEQWANRYSIGQPELSQALGGTSLDTIQKLLPPEEVPKAWARLTDIELETAHLVREVSGARKLLETLPMGYWGIVTSSRRTVALARLRSAGLGIPDFIVSSDDYSRGKPTPEPYRVALDIAGREAKSCLTFEDSLPGIESAIAAGVEVVGVATYCSPQDLGTQLWISDWTCVSVTLAPDAQLSIVLVHRQ
jgi:mannitol-1-/sugar-/sorbitol-6-phosphatase